MRNIALDNGGQGGHASVMPIQPHNAGEPPKLDNGGLPSPAAVGEPKRRLLASFSTGETSARMVKLILDRMREEYDEIVIVFANTSREREEALIFGDLCDRFIFRPLGFDLVWLEAVIHHGVRKGPTHRIVTFETAARDGSVFEEAIKKYGIPNKKYPHCTRSLKLDPITSYARSIGWARGTYDTAIGIRADEIDRMDEKRVEKRLTYPLATRFPHRKPQINYHWVRQPFRLQLKGYQSNCKDCWKKSKRKRFTIMRETPEAFDWPRRMEAQYGLVGPEFNKPDEPVAEGYRRVFSRGEQSIEELEAENAALGDAFVPAEDDSIIFEFDFDMDEPGGCGGESCEPGSDLPDDFDLEDLAA